MVFTPPQFPRFWGTETFLTGKEGVFRITPSLFSQRGLHRFSQTPFPSGDRGCNRPPVLGTAAL